MQSVDLPFGTLCIPTGGRYHPALVAQAAATLADLAPSRLRWIAAGSGEALNERPLGAGWPSKEERNDRLFEGVSMIRSLWAGETVTKRSGYMHADRLKIWSRPSSLPKIYGAALSPETAYWMGSWADGLIAVRKPLEAVKGIIDAFREGGGKDKPIVLQFQLSWAPARDEALHQAWDQWRHCSLQPEKLANLSTPEEFDAATEEITTEELDQRLCIAARAGDHIEWIKDYPPRVSKTDIPDPNAPATFEASKLDWTAADRPTGKQWAAWLRNLLDIRRERIVPLLADTSGYAGLIQAAPDGCVFIDWQLSGHTLYLRANLSPTEAQLGEHGAEPLFSTEPATPLGRLAPFGVSVFLAEGRRDAEAKSHPA